MCFGKLIAVRLDKSLYGLILNWIYAKRKTRPLETETIFPNYLTAVCISFSCSTSSTVNYTFVRHIALSTNQCVTVTSFPATVHLAATVTARGGDVATVVRAAVVTSCCRWRHERWRGRRLTALLLVPRWLQHVINACHLWTKNRTILLSHNSGKTIIL